MNISIRRIAEIILGPIVIKRYVSSTFGKGIIFASAKVGGLKYLLKPYSKLDPELVKIAKIIVKKNDVVWDIGGNVGLFSVISGLLAGDTGCIIAFEADTDAIALLNRTALINSNQFKLTIVPIAISSSLGFLKFAIAKRARASNAIKGYGHSQMGGVLEERTIPCFTLDYLLEFFPTPNVLKIDVEGAEVEVLKGALKLLGDFHPTIYCEVGSSTLLEVTDILSKSGYQVFDAAEFSVGNKAECTPSTVNIIAINTNKECMKYVQ